MERRDFMKYTGIGLAGLMLPGFGRAIAAEHLVSTLDVGPEEGLADTALDRRHRRRRQLLRRAHRPLPAPVRDHPRRQGAERRQHRIDRRRRARDRQRHLGLRRHQRPVAPRASPRPRARRSPSPRPTRKAQTAPVQLAPTPGVGEVSWQTPIVQERDGGADQGKGRPAAQRQRRRDQGRRQLRQLDAVPGQRAEIFRLHRWLLHRPGRAPHLGADVRSPRSTRPAASSAPATACPRRWAWATNTWTAARRARSSRRTA